MMKLEKTNKQDYWMVRIPQFPSPKREALHILASSKRMSTSAFIASLLDKELEKSTAETTSHPNSDRGEIRDGLPG